MDCKQVCRECPMRRKGMQGWLGAASPEEFMGSVMSDYPMPCHKTIDYADPSWKEKWEAGEGGEHCAGVAIFFANICKRSRDRDRPTLSKDKEKIFASPQEFIDYHSAARVKSWL